MRDGDLVLVPWGYHPFCAAPGYDFYYLNALAGDQHSMAATDDPALAWLRDAWGSMDRDPRVPLVEAVRRGTVAGALVAAQLACSEAMPRLDELEEALA